MLASAIDVPYSELAPLLLPRNELVEMDRDETWWLIAAFVDRRLGEIMAARQEIQKALEKDRSNRVLRVAMSRRERKSPPARS